MSKAKQTPAILSALANPERLKLLISLLDDTRTVDRTGREKDISRFAKVGLVNDEGHTTFEQVAQIFSTCLDEVRTILNDNRTPRTSKYDLADLPFDMNGRLQEIPSNPRQRSILLAWLADEVLPAGELTEKQVNRALSEVTDDYVMVRRYLVDENYLLRTPDGSAYWKADA